MNNSAANNKLFKIMNPGRDILGLTNLYKGIQKNHKILSQIGSIMLTGSYR